MRCRKNVTHPGFLPRNADGRHKAGAASLQASLDGPALNRWQSLLPSMVPVYQSTCGVGIYAARDVLSTRHSMQMPFDSLFWVSHRVTGWEEMPGQAGHDGKGKPGMTEMGTGHDGKGKPGMTEMGTGHDGNGNRA